MSNLISGWFDYQDFYANIITPHLQKCERGKFVEVGVWFGDSIFYLEECLSGNKSILYAVDHWNGSNEKIHQIQKDLANKKHQREDGLYSEFLSRHIQRGSTVIPIRADSSIAMSIFDNESIDAVFLDAGHTYTDVCNDISFWKMKIKSGGIISGHDYNTRWPGVVEAVNSYFTNLKTSGSVWYTEV